MAMLQSAVRILAANYLCFSKKGCCRGNKLALGFVICVSAQESLLAPVMGYRASTGSPSFMPVFETTLLQTVVVFEPVELVAGIA